VSTLEKFIQQKRARLDELQQFHQKVATAIDQNVAALRVCEGQIRELATSLNELEAITKEQTQSSEPESAEPANPA